MGIGYFFLCIYGRLKWSFLGQIEMSVYIYIYTVYILYPMKKNQEGLLQYRCSAAALNTWLIKLGMFHSSFYNMKVNINFFFHIF